MKKISNKKIERFPLNPTDERERECYVISDLETTATKLEYEMRAAPANKELVYKIRLQQLLNPRREIMWKDWERAL